MSRTPVIATVTIPQNGKADVKYDIVREVGPNADWHNRFVQNPVTKVPTCNPRSSKHVSDEQEIICYCEREPDYVLNDTKLVFHRGDKNGPIMATAVPCPYQKYQTDIHFVTPDLVVPLKHKHHAHYTQRAHNFHLHGHHDSGFRGKFRPSVFEGNRQKITGDDAGKVDMQDLVLVTVMTTQERAEEVTGKATMAYRRAGELGITV